MKVLIVDDSPSILMLLSALAQSIPDVDSITYSDPTAALAWCEEGNADLVLVDYVMPVLNGVQFIEGFRKIPVCRDIPIVMITGAGDKGVMESALVAGATDFLLKPVVPSEFCLRVRNLLALRSAQNLLKDRAKQLQNEVDSATAVVLDRESELIMRLAKAAEFRDPETGGHIARMARYSELIARELDMPREFQSAILRAAPLHDVGKLGTPDSVLLKPGKLDAEEMDIMRLHVEMGATILANSTAPLIQMAAEIAGGHHEKYDGSGYPWGLVGERIPLSARIVAVADVFDALTSERPYKRPWPLEDARKFIADNAGSHFCPKCVQAFLGAWDEVLRIRQGFLD